MATLHDPHADLLEALIQLRRRESSGAGTGEVAGLDAICPLLGDEDILWFEIQCAVTLPPAYRSYLQTVGDGWPRAAGSAEGLFPLGHGLGDDPGELPAFGLAFPCQLSPEMSARSWPALQARLQGAAGQGGPAHTEALARVYGGILPVGAGGMGRVYCVVLNGLYAGRVVSVDPAGLKPPVFSPAADFLLWYARFLRETFSLPAERMVALSV